MSDPTLPASHRGITTSTGMSSFSANTSPPTRDTRSSPMFMMPSLSEQTELRFESPQRRWNREQFEKAIEASLEQSARESRRSEKALRTDELREANNLHGADLSRTQSAQQVGTTVPENASVLILVKFPDFAQTGSCRSSQFQTSRLRLTLDQVLNTGSEFLKGLLKNEKRQRRAKKAAAPLPEGVTHVLDLSPTTDEDEFTVALQRLTIPQGIQLWHRSISVGVSPLAVAGHDDACDCLVPLGEPYPFRWPPKDIEGAAGEVCIWDLERWPIDLQCQIPDFCQTRWGANILRLFRSIAQPPGHKDLHIDSAPRMWTLVGLFSMFGMTNKDILRDEVTAWFNTDRNYMFMELLPEETLRIGLTLGIPLLTEPAFRILVNERALEVARGQPRAQPKQMIFGRRCSDFSGTADAESISRIIEHAGSAMADRYREAIDSLLRDDALDVLATPEWQKLCALGDVLPKDLVNDKPHPVRILYDHLLAEIRADFRHAVDAVIKCPSTDLPTRTLADLWPNCKVWGRLPDWMGTFSSRPSWRYVTSNMLTVEEVESKRAYSVPKHDLATTQSFHSVYTSLNTYQRALCPFIWEDLHSVEAVPENDYGVAMVATALLSELDRAAADGLLGPDYVRPTGMEERDWYTAVLFGDVLRRLHARVEPLCRRDRSYVATPHLVLALDDAEMDFLRLAGACGGEGARFGAEDPDMDVDTGAPSVSDLDLPVDLGGGEPFVPLEEHFADDDDDDDDDAMSAEFADAEYAVPAAHQERGRILASLVEDEDDEDVIHTVEDFELPDEFYDEASSDIHMIEDYDEEEDAYDMISASDWA